MTDGLSDRLDGSFSISKTRPEECGYTIYQVLETDYRPLFLRISSSAVVVAFYLFARPVVD